MLNKIINLFKAPQPIEVAPIKEMIYTNKTVYREKTIRNVRPCDMQSVIDFELAFYKKYNKKQDHEFEVNFIYKEDTEELIMQVIEAVQ